MRVIVDETEKEIADLMSKITKSAIYEENHNNFELANNEFPETHLDFGAINKRNTLPNAISVILAVVKALRIV